MDLEVHNQVRHETSVAPRRTQSYTEPQPEQPPRPPIHRMPTIIMFRSKVLRRLGLQASSPITGTCRGDTEGMRSVRRVLVDVAYDAAKAPGQPLRVRHLRSRHQLEGAPAISASSSR